MVKVNSAPVVYRSMDNSGSVAFRLKWPAEALGVEVRDIKTMLGSVQENVIVHNPVHLHLWEHLAKLKVLGARITVGIDDDFSCLPAGTFAFYEYHGKNPNSLADFNVVREAAKIADSLVVTSDALAMRYGRHHPNLHIIPNYLPDFYYDISSDSQWGIGWSANIDGHKGDGEVLRGVLAKFKDEGVRIVGKPPSLPIEKYESVLGVSITEYKEWLDLNGPYQKAVSEFQVGIVPLRDTAFNRAKTALKGLEYAALGVPFVHSAHPEYTKLNAGLEAIKPKHWGQIINKLLTDEEFFSSEKIRNRVIAESYSLSNHRQEWADAWNVRLN